MIVSKPPRETSITSKIKSRGYWRVQVHPAEFSANRIGDIADLPKLMEKSAVSLRGWDFPHVGRETPVVESDWIRSEVDWSGFVESWVLFQSGLFLFLGGIREDWRDEDTLFGNTGRVRPGKLLNVHDAIFKFVEIYEFASRLASSLSGNDQFTLSIQLFGLQGRHLYMSDFRRHMRSEWYSSKADDFCWKATLDRPALLANTRKLSIEPVVELFKRFNWENPSPIVAEIQDELANRR